MEDNNMANVTEEIVENVNPEVIATGIDWTKAACGVGVVAFAIGVTVFAVKKLKKGKATEELEDKSVEETEED